MDKYEVAQILREIGMLIELTDKNPKKGIAYRKASFVVETIPNLNKAVEEHSLESFPGIGKSISKMISILVKKGYLPYYNNLRNKIPLTLLDLTQIPGLTLKRIRHLYETLQITDLMDLEEAIKDESIHTLKGFGPSYIKKIQRRIDLFKSEGGTLLYAQALRIAHVLIEKLKNYSKKIEIVGSLRRKLEIINQIDLIASTKKIEESIYAFTQHGLIKEILGKENKQVSVLLKHGIIANLYLATERDFAYTLFKYTGSEAHIKSLQKVSYPLKIKKYVKEEREIYRSLQLPYIVPELRENMGEVEAAKSNRLPHLIEENDIRGAFHCHTLDSDGANSLDEMVKGARELGWEYIGISDHSKSSYQANGLSEERLLNQLRIIRKLNAQFNHSFKIFAGVECDILKDGQLDFSDDVLKKLDFVIASVHRYFTLDEDEMTRRIIRAIENPYVTMIGHLTGRLLRHRDPYKVNIPKIIDACAVNQKIIELNAFPSRLDMDWRWWKIAKEKGVKCSINPDAHSTNDLLNVKNFGINIARKGWLEKEDVVNTLSLQKIKKTLKYKSF